ncbi:MAG TPA: tetratricopeptide repeat protein, partial [Thermoanaerobaculia bacterium]|nr:tetratricopeptide repeat protein [Thermoanaerobaculia bacterium]
ESTIRDFPEDVVARNGRAEVLRSLNRLEESLSAYESTIRDFPENVVARNGRAEVLRSLNRLEESLSAYDVIAERFPYDVVARNGRATVLAALGRFEEVLAQLPDKEPVTDQDWIAYHIRGMVLLRMGKTEEAATVFRKGVNLSPHVDQQDYFRTGLALARLKQRDYTKAVEALDYIETTGADLEASANLLRLHALGSLGKRSRAVEAYQQVQAAGRPELRDVGEELRRRYIDGQEGRNSEEWILEKETAVLLALLASFSVQMMRRRAFPQ